MARRLDLELVRRGLVRSRTAAQALIGQGKVLVDRQVVTKASTGVGPEQAVEVETDPWVSRAAHKLIGALEGLGWNRIDGRVLDAGASTGGFTQVLLARGAERVYAVDVGHGQLAAEIAANPRVEARERLNLRDLTLADLDGDPVRLVVADVSFISLRLLLEPLFAVIGSGGAALLMVKPQFEVGRERLGEGGVVRDQELRDQAVADVVAEAARLGWSAVWQAPSVLPGPSGNVEYFVLFRRMREVSAGMVTLGA